MEGIVGKAQSDVRELGSIIGLTPLCDVMASFYVKYKSLSRLWPLKTDPLIMTLVSN